MLVPGGSGPSSPLCKPHLREYLWACPFGPGLVTGGVASPPPHACFAARSGPVEGDPGGLVNSRRGALSVEGCLPWFRRAAGGIFWAGPDSRGAPSGSVRAPSPVAHSSPRQKRLFRPFLGRVSASGRVPGAPRGSAQNHTPPVGGSPRAHLPVVHLGCHQAGLFQPVSEFALLFDEFWSFYTHHDPPRCLPQVGSTHSHMGLAHPSSH